MKTDRILLVDDDLMVIKLMNRMLAEVADIQYATSGNDALRLVREAPPDLVLLDGQMPGMSGFEVCEALKADPATAHVPVIFVTALNDTAFEVAGFEAGAADFITKPLSAPLLVARVKTQLRMSHLANELRRVATVDGLTQVANRRFFDDTLRKEWHRALKRGDPLGVLRVEIDHFKPFNDRYGYAAGDRCLQRVAKTLTQACRHPGDTVARYGGAEFAILLPETPPIGVETVATRLLSAIESLGIPHAFSATARHVTVSVGASSVKHVGGALASASVDAAVVDRPPSRASSRTHFMRAAEAALQEARQRGFAQAWRLDMANVDAPEMAREILPHIGLTSFAEAA
ncbi:MAG: diguanylate cyclase [Burkholderiales bacterium]|nr:diguanylate cyclase [Burkholderiales bacterium]